MCTVLIAIGVAQSHPVVVAGHRDEFFARPATPPRAELGPGGRFLAPRDALAGGTWIGAHESGRFAVITNRTDAQYDVPDDAPSRGTLVLDAIRAATLDEAVRAVRVFETRPTAPFQLAVGDRRGGVIFVRDGVTAWEERTLSPGHPLVLSNFGPPDDRSIGEIRRAHAEWARSDLADPVRAAKALLQVDIDSDDGPALVKRADDRGTRSSTVIAETASGELLFEHAAGPPPDAEFVRHSFAPTSSSDNEARP